MGVATGINNDLPDWIAESAPLPRVARRLQAFLCERAILRSPLTFVVIVSVFLVVFYNSRFWRETIGVAHLASVEDAFFILSLFVILVLGHAAILLLAPRIFLLRIAAAAAFLIAAAAAFFIDSYAVVIDKDMIRNLVETDTQEAGAFIIPRLAIYLCFLGIVPAVVALRVKLVAPAFQRGLVQRFGFIAVALVLSTSLLFVFYSHYTSFFSEHRTRSLLNPVQPIAGFVGYVRSVAFAGDTAFVDDPESHAHSLPITRRQKPLLLFLVVGETARAGNFQLGGYARDTNPELSRIEDLYYFNDVASCGTSTAVSVPCMFSPGGRKRLDVTMARRHSNLLDAIKSAGFNVEWRENNSGSKGVAARVETINFLRNSAKIRCAHEPCYDEEMMSGLADRLRGLRQNSVIVFHTMGSHGPSYWQRYPDRFEKFKPVCRTSELWTCSHESLVNTYDNTILYTDHVLAEQIRLLQSVSAYADSLLIYVSDHGESLGEHGLYLHGTPYALAPEEQTKVPYLIWMSEGYRQRLSVDDNCLRSQKHQPLSHDAIYHTVLGALGLRNGFYKRDLDMVGRCMEDRVGQAAPVSAGWPATSVAR